MELNINNLTDFAKNAEIIWMSAKASVPRYARSSGLFKEVSIPEQTGNTREFSEIDLEEYASRKGESDQAVRARVQQGYSKIGRLYRIAKDIGVSWEWRTQGKYSEIKQRLQNLGKLGDNRMDLDLTARITFGFSTAYTDPDGVSVDVTVGDTLALFSASHTLRASATTFRNYLANNPQFTQSTLESMETMRVQNSYNQFGEKMTMPADIIFTTEDPNLVNTVKIVMKSMTSTGQANSGVINPYENKYKHVVLPRIAVAITGGVVTNDTTKAKYWGIASSEMSTAYLGVHEDVRLKMPEQYASAEEFSTDDWNFGVRAGYMIVIVSAGWISVSKGDGSA